MKAVFLWVATLKAPCCNAVAASLVCLWWTSGDQTCHQRQGDQMTTFDLTDVLTTYLLFTRLQWQQTDFPLYQALICIYCVRGTRVTSTAVINTVGDKLYRPTQVKFSNSCTQYSSWKSIHLFIRAVMILVQVFKQAITISALKSVGFW